MHRFVSAIDTMDKSTDAVWYRSRAGAISCSQPTVQGHTWSEVAGEEPPADLVPAVELVRVERVLGAERVLRRPGPRHRSTHVVDREDRVPQARLDQARTGGDQPREVAELAVAEEAGYEVAGAMVELEDALPPVAEVAGHHAGADAVVVGGRKVGVRAAAGDTHRPLPGDVSLRPRGQIVDRRPITEPPSMNA